MNPCNQGHSSCFFRRGSLISSYQTGGSEGSNAVPTDQVSFNFAKIDVTYKPQKADGSLDAGIHFKYDLKAQKEA